MIAEGLHCPTTIPSRDMVEYPSLGLGVYHGQLDKREHGLVILLEGNPIQRELVHQSFVFVHSVSYGIPSRRLVWPNDVGNGAVIASINEG